MFRIGKFFSVIAIIAMSSGCAGSWYRVPPPTGTVDDHGRVTVAYPRPGQVIGHAILGGLGPTLYERTRNGGTEVSDGFIEFQTDQARTELILDPGGDVASAYIKYKGVVIIKRLCAPNWNFFLENQYNSGTRVYELWLRHEEAVDEMMTEITVVSSPPRSLHSNHTGY